MSIVKFPLELDEELLASLTKAAEESGRDAAQLLRDLAEGYVRQQQGEDDYDAWFRREVREGIREADAASEDDWIPHEQAMAEVRASLEAHIAAKAGK